MLDDDSILVRNKNNDSLIDFSVNNFDDDYRNKVTNFFRPNNDKFGSPNNKNTNLNNQSSKIIKNNSFGFRPRFFKNNISTNTQQINNNSNTVNNFKPIKTSSQSIKTNENATNSSNVAANSGFFDFTQKKPLTNNNSTNISSLNSSLLSTKDLELSVGGNSQSITLATKPKKQSPKEILTVTRQITKPVEKILDLSFGSEELHEFNSVKRWSNQLSSTTHGGAMSTKPMKNSIFGDKSSSIDSNETVLTNRKVKFDHIASVQTLPPAINKIVDIIEREGTTFSIKMSYDHPFAHNRDNALSPHTYLDLDIDPNLELARQNTFMNKMIDFDIFENKNSKKAEKEKPLKSQINNNVDLYQKLNNPCPASLYSELNTSVDLESYRSRNKKSTGKNRNYIKVKSKKAQSTKLDKNGKKKDPAVLDDNLIVESMIEYKMIEKKEINDLLDDGVVSMADFQSSSIYQSKKDANVGKHDFKILESLIATIKSRDILKEPTVREAAPTKAANNSKSSSKQQKAAKGASNKKTIKEFKYCILTDLKIGEGEFSETFQGYRYDLGPPLKVAAKRLKNANKEKDDQNMINLLSEISVLTQLGKHDNVIEYLGVHNLNNEMYMVFEYAEKGDLKRLLDLCRKNTKRDTYVSNLYKLRIAYEIACGMDYISSLDIVHKDLAARNILLDKEFSCKISDFGINQPFKKVPIRWMAPESVNKLLFTPSSDVWSFGVLLWEVWTFGMVPYPGMTDDEVVGRINQWYRLYKPNDCPNEVYNIMLNCWKEYHKARPKFSNLKNKFKELHKQMSESS